MITKCNYCEYHKETDAPENLLRLSAKEDQPEEDKLLWIDRLVRTMGYKDFDSVKIHMGMKHKGQFSKGERPTTIWTARELEIISESL